MLFKLLYGPHTHTFLCDFLMWLLHFYVYLCVTWIIFKYHHWTIKSINPIYLDHYFVYHFFVESIIHFTISRILLLHAHTSSCDLFLLSLVVGLKCQLTLSLSLSICTLMTYYHCCKVIRIYTLFTLWVHLNSILPSLTCFFFMLYHMKRIA